MVFIVNEEKAIRIFEKYRNVAAFTLGKSKGLADADGKLVISYEKLNFLPDNDTINAVVNGDIKGKKVIKAAQKKLLKVKMDDEYSGIALSMLQVIGILQSDSDRVDGMSKKAYKKHIAKYGPNIMVFVLDGENEARDKFLTKYVKGLFEVYGYECITSGKVIKKLFKGKTKKINVRVRDFIDNNKGMSLSKSGRALYRATRIYYSNELRQSALCATSNLMDGKLTEKKATGLAKHLVHTFSNLSVLDYNVLDLDKKTTEKLQKAQRAKNKASVKHYKELRNILKMMNVEGLKLPKVEFGVKNKKSNDPKPVMDGKRFVKFFAGKKKKNKANRALLYLVYFHLTCRNMEIDVGSTDYNKNMADVVSSIYDNNVSKAFVAAAKEYAKAAAA